MKGSLFLRLCLFLPVLAGLLVYFFSGDYLNRVTILMAIGPYTVFALFFWGFTIEYAERRLRRALLVAPLAFIPILALFILLVFMTLHGEPAVGVSLVVAAVCSILVGYAFVGLTLGLYAGLQRSGWLSVDQGDSLTSQSPGAGA